MVCARQRQSPTLSAAPACSSPHFSLDCGRSAPRHRAVTGTTTTAAATTAATVTTDTIESTRKVTRGSRHRRHRRGHIPRRTRPLATNPLGPAGAPPTCDCSTLHGCAKAKLGGFPAARVARAAPPPSAQHPSVGPAAVAAVVAPPPSVIISVDIVTAAATSLLIRDRWQATLSNAAASSRCSTHQRRLQLLLIFKSKAMRVLSAAPVALAAPRPLSASRWNLPPRLPLPSPQLPPGESPSLLSRQPQRCPLPAALYDPSTPRPLPNSPLPLPHCLPPYPMSHRPVSFAHQRPSAPTRAAPPMHSRLGALQ